MNKLFKKLLITATAILLVICYSTSVFAAGFDINNDNTVNVNDVTFLQNEISNFSDNTDYDLNNDGKLDVNDVSYLQIEISKSSLENNTQINISCTEYKKMSAILLL